MSHYEEFKLFFRLWAKNPGQMGTLAPISQSFADCAAQRIPLAGKIVELGAGTGMLTRALLKKGLPAHNLAAVELSQECCEFLNESFSESQKPLIIQGDAASLPTILPEEFQEADTIVSVLPFMYFPIDLRDTIIDAAFQCLRKGNTIFHLTYSPISPFRHRKDIIQQRILSKWMNLPPAFIWKFQKRQD